MIESFIISIVANIATSVGSKALKSLMNESLYRKIETAYSKAIKRWCKNSDIAKYEEIWTRQRLENIVSLMEDPRQTDNISTSNLNLLSIFKEELQKDDATWRYLEGEFYTTLMVNLLDVKGLVEAIRQELESRKINSIELKNRLVEQSLYQVEKNIASGKYIPDTFMEVTDLKDHIRYFSDPYMFYELLFNKSKDLNFDYLNRRLKELNAETYEFEISDSDYEDIVDYNTLYENANKLYRYLHLKSEELEGDGNEKWKFSHKLKCMVKDVGFLNKKICILTSNAGQGKTNFLCDFTYNVLIKRGIPSLYINGYEIDPSNIAESFSRCIYPSGNYTFQEILEAIGVYCTSTLKPFIIIVDGLNENGRAKLLNTNLCRLIKELTKNNFVKIILTCRTEYYQEQYSEIGSLFSDSTIIIDHIHSHLEDRQKKRLVRNYLSYFKISTKLSDEVIKKFTENILLLRIFSEAYKGTSIPITTNLHKEELFDLYNKRMYDDIASKMSESGYPASSKHLIKNFIERLISHMIETDQFNNIDINCVAGSDTQEQIEIYNRFLDENIILRRDLIAQAGAFGISEVINFTYDEFRDYLISSYLINRTYKQSIDKFQTFIVNHTVAKSILAEGLIPFLFLISKKCIDEQLENIISSFDWYDNIYLYYIWEVNDQFVTEQDKIKVKSYLPKHNDIIIPSLIYNRRWDPDKFQILNIYIVLEYLSSLDDDDLEKDFFSIWYEDGYAGRNYEDLDHILKITQKVLDDESFMKKRNVQNIFEIILYLAPFNGKAERLYLSYYGTYKNHQQLTRVQERCNSSLVKNFIARIL